MKRKVEFQAQDGPISAVAARRSRQQAILAAQAASAAEETPASENPPTKKSKPSPERPSILSNASATVKPAALRAGIRRPTSRPTSSVPSPTEVAKEVDNPEELDEDRANSSEEEGPAYANGGEEEESYLSTSNLPTKFENFPLSKTRIDRKGVVYSDEHTLCVRLKLKTNLVLVGQYDLWVKRGVVSIMGAKLHASPKLYRIYAPTTHSLPVIKCVSAIDDYAEIEISSCHTGLPRLSGLSSLYHRIWKGKMSPADNALSKGIKTKWTFSVLYMTADDPLNRYLRPLHLDKKWSATIKTLSQRGPGLRVLTCGPKGSGKSTFNRYLLNHLLSPPPLSEGSHQGQDGVAFLDLDPGQPEFLPMGQVYLAHLKRPSFGPSFAHSTLDGSQDGSIIRAHHLGASSPKDDPDNYVMLAMDLLSRYHVLLQTHPHCPLIINYPGWIFGLGLELLTWFVRSLGLSNVVYMSEKGPAEVVEPLAQATAESRLPLAILPSQPTDYVTRSSAQLRAMQMQSYFHTTQHTDTDPDWTELPVNHIKPLIVSYAGPEQGIMGIVVTGTRHDPDMLYDILDGAVVGVVALEHPSAIASSSSAEQSSFEELGEEAADSERGSDAGNEDPMDEDPESSGGHPVTSSEHSNITRTKEGMPYLFVGSGTCTPLDPKSSHCLGLAIVRSIDADTKTLELVSPIPRSALRETLEKGHKIVLVRGQMDNPNWAISEEYFAARRAARHHRKVLAQLKAAGNGDVGEAAAELSRQEDVAESLKERIRRATAVPWVNLNESAVDGQKDRNRVWKLSKKAVPRDSFGSDSDT